MGKSRSLIFLTLLMAVGARFVFAESSGGGNPGSEAWADALLDKILSPDQGHGYKEPPSHDWEAEQLIALRAVGWDRTYLRFSQGNSHPAITKVLGNRSPYDPESEKARTAKILILLEKRDFKGRRWIPQIVRRREPVRVNNMLRPFLTDPDPELREALLLQMNVLTAGAEDIEAAVEAADDDSEPVRFRANEFLRRATGHIPNGGAERDMGKAGWTEWWTKQNPAEMQAMIKRELTACANLLVSPDEQIRERAGSVLVAHSGQTFYGFHQEKMWWGVHNGVRSRESWLQWIALRYSPKTSLEATIWEFEYGQQNPDRTLEALRATITMNVGDLDSNESSVRSLARGSIAGMLGDACPFRFGTLVGSSDREDDWLNGGIKLWWQQRMQTPQK